MTTNGSGVTRILGTWWTPSQHDQHAARCRVAGQLTVSDQDWNLTSVGSLLCATDSELLGSTAKESRPKAIFGKTQEPKAISLLDIVGRTNSVTTIGGNTELTGVSSETWAFDTYASGDIWIDSTYVINSVTISIQGLSLWANGYRENPHTDESVFNFTDDTTTFTIPSPWNAVVSLGNVDIRLKRTWVASHHPSSGFQANQEAVFILDGEIPITDVRDKWVAPLHRLVSFFTLGPVEVVKVTAHIDVPTDERTKRFPLDMHFRYHQREPEYGPPVTRVVHWLVPLDQLIDIGMSYETLISRWLQSDKAYQATTGYLLESADKTLPLDRQLLAAFMGLEAYHTG